MAGLCLDWVSKILGWNWIAQYERQSAHLWTTVLYSNIIPLSVAVVACDS